VPAIIATYFNDPGCPWGYSFRPAHARLLWRFGDQIEWRLVVIGLSESADEYEARGFTPAHMAASNRTFQQRFGMPFSFQLKPRMAATSRACRAIVAVREADPALANDALRALQLMNFTTQGLLDDDDAVRAALARVPGVDAEAAVARIDDPALIAAYDRDRAAARSATGRPIAVQGRSASSDGTDRYTAPSVIFERGDGARTEVGGFQPFEAYDTALANLDPSLERRRPPADALSVVQAFPHGVTTAEVAAVLRPADVVDADLRATEQELTALAGDGAVICEPAGGDALWRVPRPGEITRPGFAASERRAA
jgi:protein-disulfide isomerase-like protein with CxxC motif